MPSKGNFEFDAAWCSLNFDAWSEQRRSEDRSDNSKKFAILKDIDDGSARKYFGDRRTKKVILQR
jgi:hypothetical protein